MRYLFGIIALLFTINAHAQPGVQDEDWDKVKNENFDSLLVDLKIDFSIPDGFTESNLVENEKVLYHKAYGHNSSGFEIRIWIRDLRNQNTPQGLSTNKFSKSMITMLSLNSSGYILPNIPKITVFDLAISSSEFNADWLATAVFLPKLNEFNTGFEVCSIIGMRKNETAEVYVFFMVSDREKEAHLLKDLIQVVKFQ